MTKETGEELLVGVESALLDTMEAHDKLCRDLGFLLFDTVKVRKSRPINDSEVLTVVDNLAFQFSTLVEVMRSHDFSFDDGMVAKVWSDDITKLREVMRVLLQKELEGTQTADVASVLGILTNIENDSEDKIESIEIAYKQNLEHDIGLFSEQLRQ
ncbi:MAG TPA: hypothetical protein PL051_03875 [Candidatus Saccharibacteria bacterium]|nr:hypothetical protein [Candidatus Saccharibacteria bacterium]